MESLASFPVSVDWFDSTSDAELLCSILRCDLHPAPTSGGWQGCGGAGVRRGREGLRIVPGV